MQRHARAQLRACHRQQASLWSHAPPHREHHRQCRHHPHHSPPRRRGHVLLPHDIARETTAHHLPFQWRLRRPRRTARKRAAARGTSLGRLSDVHQQRGASRRAARLGSKRRGGERGAVAARRRGRRDVRSIRRVGPREPRRGVPRRGPGVGKKASRRCPRGVVECDGASRRWRNGGQMACSSTYAGIKQLARTRRDCRFYALETAPHYRRYIGAFDVLCAAVRARFDPRPCLVQCP